MILWRPTGPQELALIAAADMRAFPPRLPEQPLFYPVLAQEYAQEIARDWNAVKPPGAGYVLRFELEDDYARGFEPRTVGARRHRELWIPAEELERFNAHIVGPITLSAAFFGPRFVCQPPGEDCDELTIQLCFPCWVCTPASELGLSAAELERRLGEIRQRFERAGRGALLCANGTRLG